ncbi:MAG: hypothetical protein M3Z27_06760 [Actinomycetota bacterium]|nr:hypothetical protein [Actinomycetota bacterium]
MARQAALRVPGVSSLDNGPTGLFACGEGGRRVNGVVCAALSEDAYEISLRLVCDPVPLAELSERVRAGIDRAAADAGIGLERVHVHIADLTEAMP